MRYLLDTNICIALIKNKPTALKKLQRCTPGDVLISAISVAELRYGIAKSNAVERNHVALQEFLEPFELLSFDELCTQAYGTLRSELKQKGTPIGPLDTLIAAQAVAYDLVLVTNNEREFNRVHSLKRIENWLN